MAPEIPADESWLYENPKVLEAREGKLVDRPSYADFAEM